MYSNKSQRLLAAVRNAIVFHAALFLALHFVSASVFAGEIENPHLFEVRKGEAVSWMLGTLHSGVAYSELKYAVEPLLNRSSVAYFENADRERARLWQSNPVEAFLTSDIEDLKTGAPLTTVVQQIIVREYGIHPAIAEVLRTESCNAFMWALTLKQPFLDHEIFRIAALKKLELRALDTDAVRLEANRLNAIADGTSVKAEKCDLERTYISSSLESLTKSSNEFTAYYRSGKPPTPRMYGIAGLTYRNQVWLKELVPAMNRGGVFVAVGAGHLYESYGLIAELSRAGCTIQRLNP